jgi:hypothetical protein
MFKTPFPHLIIDNFISDELALELSNEFPDYNDEKWFYYNNPLENKKANNNWGMFPSTTYKFFQYLNSEYFMLSLTTDFNIKKLYSDNGLHGAGWHMHSRGGKLNVHLDYSIHPKLKLQRKLNLILYLTPDWDPAWGGNLEFWEHDPETNRPLKLSKVIENKFKRAVIFDTTQNSWHGFAENISCPENIYRKSIAVYYLIDPVGTIESRFRALYAPSTDQKNNPDIEELIRKRSE